MEREQVIENLKEYNAWRGGANIEMLDLAIISKSIDEAIRLLEEDINKKTNKMKEEQRKAFESAAKPLMKYLAENHNPHTTIILTSTECEIVQGIQSITTNEFLVD